MAGVMLKEADHCHDCLRSTYSTREGSKNECVSCGKVWELIFVNPLTNQRYWKFIRQSIVKKAQRENHAIYQEDVS